MAKRRRRTNANVPAKGRLRDMADMLWSIAVREDWRNRCAVCGATKCEAHHIVPRQHEALRYDLRNGIALCARHHKFDADISPHQNAAGWIKWLQDNYHIRHEWLIGVINDNSHKAFNGTKNSVYYIGVIQLMREWVSNEDFIRVVGVKFTKFMKGEINTRDFL